MPSTFFFSPDCAKSFIPLSCQLTKTLLQSLRSNWCLVVSRWHTMLAINYCTNPCRNSTQYLLSKWDWWCSERDWLLLAPNASTPSQQPYKTGSARYLGTRQSSTWPQTECGRMCHTHLHNPIQKNSTLPCQPEPNRIVNTGTAVCRMCHHGPIIMNSTLACPHDPDQIVSTGRWMCRTRRHNPIHTNSIIAGPCDHNRIVNTWQPHVLPAPTRQHPNKFHTTHSWLLAKLQEEK